MVFMDIRLMTGFGVDLIVSRSGYTGEDGYEISVPAEWADEARRGMRHHGDHVVAALLQAAHDFDRLVGADAAGDAERDQHGGIW